MFDKSPLGENVHLGVRFRRVLAPHIFRRCGRNFKAFHFVKLSFGYNMDVGDDVVVHRHVLLDDRGGIGSARRVDRRLREHLQPHARTARRRDVETPAVVIGAACASRTTRRSWPACTWQDDSMLGALAVATKDIASGDVALGIPAA
jgi:acetyltransferase-like isoleucine patch superfamily enzyme